MLKHYNTSVKNWICVSLLTFLASFSLHAKPLSDAEAEKFVHKINDDIEVIKFGFDGHTYICFWYMPNCAANGWVHDPDCKKCRGDKK